MPILYGNDSHNCPNDSRVLSRSGLWGISAGVLCRIRNGLHVADRRTRFGLSGADGIDSSRRDLGNRSCN